MPSGKTWSASPATLFYGLASGACGRGVGNTSLLPHIQMGKTLDTNITRIWNGFKVIFTMTKWWLYVIYTIGIWTCYFFETYVCFFAFDFTRGTVHNPHMAAGFIPGLVVFVFGSMSMAIPSNGGLGLESCRNVCLDSFRAVFRRRHCIQHSDVELRGSDAYRLRIVLGCVCSCHRPQKQNLST